MMKMTIESVVILVAMAGLGIAWHALAVPQQAAPPPPNPAVIKWMNTDLFRQQQREMRVLRGKDPIDPPINIPESPGLTGPGFPWDVHLDSLGRPQYVPQPYP